jgi:hypothetical protein
LPKAGTTRIHAAGISAQVPKNARSRKAVSCSSRIHSARTTASASSSSASVDVSMVIVLTPFRYEGGDAAGPLLIRR